MTLRCPPLIATPRRRIGGRCRKWAVSTQHSADRRRCTSCIICGLQFAHGEARLQLWGNRDSDNAYVHAQCINGGVAHDQELHPTLPTDQDAVETIARQRDSKSLQTQRSFSLSRRALIKPPLLLLLMTIRVCLVEKTLYDWTRRSWTFSGLTLSHGTASRTSAAPRTSSHHHGSSLLHSKPQHAILRVITHHGPSSLAFEKAWNVLVLSSWLLLCSPAVDASESNYAHFLSHA